MWEIFTTVATNLAMSFDKIVLFVITVGGLIGFAKDFKLGAILQFIFCGLCFMWFYSQSLNWALPLSMMIFWFIVMCFSIYALRNKADTGGII